MLTALAIRDVVLIEALDLDFAPGLGVLTGETGAGKSILLDALGLVLGARADSGLVRHGAAQASVTATFEVPEGGAVASLLEQNDLTIDRGDPLIVRRTVKADGGSRAFVNDQPASAGLLRELGPYLVEIHGQHDDRGLLNPRGHRALLDAFAQADAGAVAVAHRAWRDAEGALATARAGIEAAARDREWLEHAVAELDALAPEPGEEQALAERRRAMQRAEKIADDLRGVEALVEGSDGALSRLRQAARILERIAPDDAVLGEALAAIDRALIEGASLEERLEEARRAADFDPRAQEEDEARLFELRGVARKHRVQPDDLAALAGGEADVARLEAELRAREATYEAAARALSTARHAAATRLDAAVMAELAPLKLDAARFRTAVEPLPREQWGAHGSDRVEFMVATNPGAPFGALTRIASGGELSRFILALKVALAEEGGAATLIFDEIDRGVGGAVASAIGERLARLAAGGQLLVVTHSPQVAARGAHHLRVAKYIDGGANRTTVALLDEGERLEEIARMLSGAQVTDEARAQAERLLEVA